MSNVYSLAGRFDAAALEALCVNNTEPTFEEIRSAKEAIKSLLAEADAILIDTPVISGHYVREQPAFEQVRKTMENGGWTFCGAGYYSAAFFRAGLVIKVGFKAEDSGLLYAAWCRANQGKAGVPKVHKLASTGFCYMVLMDRLEAIVGELDKDSPSYDPQLAAEVDSVKETLNLGADGWGQHMELCRTAISIRDFFDDIANFDLHEANVMLDRNGELVITDPVSFRGDSQSFTDGGEVLPYNASQSLAA